MHDVLLDLLFILNRYVHIICTTVIVGGTLFFETIVPFATNDLRREHQLSILGRARWSFRAIVVTCAILLIATGIVSSTRRWSDYRATEQTAREVATRAPDRFTGVAGTLRRPGWWWAAHVTLGLVALCIAVALMTVRRAPAYPLLWMRVSLIALLLVIFLATTARHLRLSIYEAEHAPAVGPSPGVD
jgi:peptidoglycan/LPS O-acetylase OafA/YrhL